MEYMLMSLSEWCDPLRYPEEKSYPQVILLMQEKLPPKADKKMVQAVSGLTLGSLANH
ncbi:hypothetical protein [Hymenobacter cavernae]|uniref:Four helix bundle protein n=1 Tax=Hymenobacter cavernae TaxID=2044852 RepID=A0ABQ1UMC6_9BACT|nr:hypothetical protein [Hymenobacter cavernae]GGF22582.1 hypothetical protein GCM10011383_37750 [Hymenobacter cavernae]